jgi:hypothetical protein
MKTAITKDAGYTIVPNMDVDVFAIRVKREKPAALAETETSNYGFHKPRLNEEVEQRLDVGEGRYVSPKHMITTSKSTTKDEAGKVKEYTMTVTPVAFADLEFPLAVAHSVVMDATGRAMAMKIFDRIGVVPNMVTGGDPIVLGQITIKQRYTTKRASFLIAWYLDPRTL